MRPRHAALELFKVRPFIDNLVAASPALLAVVENRRAAVETTGSAMVFRFFVRLIATWTAAMG